MGSGKAPIKIGIEEWMKEPYVEGSADHNGHESCAGSREVMREALDSGMYRWSIEPRKLYSIRVPDVVLTIGRQYPCYRYYAR